MKHKDAGHEAGGMAGNPRKNEQIVLHFDV
jgi:hypothetical protein